MRSWWKTLGLMAGMACGLTIAQTAVHAQFPPPGPGGFGMPPGGGMPGMPVNMGAPPGGGMGMSAFSGMPPGPGADFPNIRPPSEEPVSPFSIKDEGMPNAFSELVDPRAMRPLCWQIGFNYVFLWYNASPTPPLVTTGNVFDPIPGALNQPGTTILTRPFEPGNSSAFRVTATYWIRDPELLSVDANFLVNEQRTIFQTSQSDITGRPTIGRPYFNPNLRQEDSDPRSLPDVLKGTTQDAITTRLLGAEAYLKWQGAPYAEGSRFNYTFGARWVQFDERYQSYDVSEDVGGVGFLATFSDTFATYNQFFGGQFGLEWQYKMPRMTLGLTSKIAVGPNYQTVKVSGETTLTDQQTAAFVRDEQGLYAQPSNIGSTRQVRFAVLPEFGANASFDLTDHLRFNVGYTFFLLTNTVRPGEQIDRTVNIQPLLTGGGVPPLFPEPPSFRQSTFTVHMLSLGFEFLF